MPLTILGDDDVKLLLHSLDRKDLMYLQQSLADALHYYSTATEDEGIGCCASYQPKRQQMKFKDGRTTLVMPATGNDGMGVKIVTLTEASTREGSIASAPSTERSSISSMASLSLSDPSSASSQSGANQSASTQSSSTQSSVGSSRSSTTAFDTPPESVTSEPLSHKSSNTSPKGSLTLFERDGTPRALVNAEELTAFRTALASTMLFKKRTNVHDIVVFGAGKQAYWHARLALLLRPDDIHHLNIINRSFDSAKRMIKELFSDSWPVKIPRSRVQTAIITPAHVEYDRHLKEMLRKSSAIFCTTPATQPLFPPEILTSTEGRKKGRYLVAIGSYKPHMCEIHPDIIRQAVAPTHRHHHHRHAQQGGAIVVDSVESALREAGELIQAGLGGREVVELGELILLKREAEQRRKESSTSLDSEGVEIGTKKGSSDDADHSLHEWLQRGNVIYKSVGLGLMDVTVGYDLVRLADERRVGTIIDNF
jgi:ornithine cyclodeaminase/alanine dehydrogenase-like protein (mu-crystallin family)